MLFAIVDRETLEVYETYVSDEKDDTSANRSWLRAEPKCVHLEVSPELTSDCLKCELVEENFVLSDDATKVAAKTAAAKAVAVTAAYNSMQADVFAQMNTVFGTTRSDSAQRTYDTWKVMMVKPELYSAAGIKAKFAFGEYSVGEPLDTNQKVIDYGTARVAVAEPYSVWVLQRIEQFETERATILGG